MLELIDRDFRVIMIAMLKDLVKEVDNIHNRWEISAKRWKL